MIADRLQWISTVAGNTRNPLPIFKEWLGWQRKPYRVSSRDGLNFELRPGRGDWYIYMETVLRSDYLALGQRLQPGATVVDIGANVGGFAVLAATRVGRGGRVVAVEPEPGNFRQLQINAELNPGGAKIETVSCAIGAERGEAVLHADENAAWTSFYALETHGHTVDIKVPVLTLKDLFEAVRVGHCDYLKIDTEGSEYDIIGALRPDLASHIDQITVEIHDVPGRDRSEVVSKLRTARISSKAGNADVCLSVMAARDGQDHALEDRHRTEGYRVSGTRCREWPETCRGCTESRRKFPWHPEPMPLDQSSCPTLLSRNSLSHQQ